MKFAVLGYDNTRNIGDSIQTLAVLQHIEHDYIILQRDHLNEYSGEPCVLVMNGWFSHIPTNWPPSSSITPIFFGFHMTVDAAREYSKHKEYFKRHEPIGCRDQGTADIIASWGVQSYVSGCATMTFSERKNEPQNGSVIVVDVGLSPLDRRERQDFITITQSSKIDYASNDVRNHVALALLNYYKSHAKLVITSRIHCAMPCYAMGIPVIYCGVQEYRTKIIESIGVPIFKFPRFGKVKLQNLPLAKPDYDQKKQEVAHNLRKHLLKHNIKLSSWESKEAIGKEISFKSKFCEDTIR